MSEVFGSRFEFRDALVWLGDPLAQPGANLLVAGTRPEPGEGSSPVAGARRVVKRARAGRFAIGFRFRPRVRFWTPAVRKMLIMSILLFLLLCLNLLPSGFTHYW